MQRWLGRQKSPAPPPQHRATDDEKLALFRDGYVVLPGLVPEQHVLQARRAVNRELGKPPTPAVVNRWHRKPDDFLEHVYGNPWVVALLHQTAIRAAVEQFVGPTHPLYGGQVALRFPGFGCPPSSFSPDPYWRRGWHIDGLDEEDRPKKGAVGNFTALVGVCLQDCMDDLMGNFCVFPGEHHRIAEFFQQPGAIDDVERRGDPAIRKVKLRREAQPTMLRAGDVVIAHYCLPHTIAPNTSAEIRYMIFFRFNAAAHSPGSYRRAALADIWCDWKPMQAIRAAAGPALPVQPLQPSSGSARSSSSAAALPTPEGPRGDAAAGRAAFEAERWVDAFKELRLVAPHEPDDWEVNFQAGAAATWGSYQKGGPKASEGEPFLVRAVELAPSFFFCRAVLIGNLHQQHPRPHARIVEETAMMVADAPPSDVEHAEKWAVDLFASAVENAAEGLLALGRRDEVTPFVAAAVQRHPSMATRLQQAADPRTAELQQLANTAEKKGNMGAAHRHLSELAQRRPDDYWVRVRAASAALWGRGPVADVIAHGSAAVDLDPANPVGYAVLTCGLVKHNRFAEALSAAEGMLSATSEGSAVEHGEAIVHAIQAARRASQADPPRFQALEQGFRRFAVIETRLARATKGSDDCVVM